MNIKDERGRIFTFGWLIIFIAGLCFSAAVIFDYFGVRGRKAEKKLNEIIYNIKYNPNEVFTGENPEILKQYGQNILNAGNSSEINTKADILLGYLNFRQNFTESAERHFKNAEEFYVDSGIIDKQLPMIYYPLSRIYLLNGDKEKSEEYYAKIEECFNTLNEKAFEIPYKQQLAQDIHKVSNNPEKALYILNQTIKEAQDINYPNIYKLYCQAGNISSETGKYEDSVNYNLKALETLNKIDKNYFINNKVQNLNLTLPQVKKINDKLEKEKVYILKNLKEGYELTGNREEAAKYNSEMLKIPIYGQLVKNDPELKREEQLPSVNESTDKNTSEADINNNKEDNKEEKSEWKNGKLWLILGSIIAILAFTAWIIYYVKKRKAIARLIDKNTGFATAEGLENYLESSWEDDSEEEFPIAFVKVHLDKFGKFNTEYGKAAADKMIKSTAATISKFAGEDSFKAKTDTGDFMIILSGSYRKVAEDRAEQIRKEIHMKNVKNKFSSVDGRVTVSIGIAVAPSNQPEYENYIKQADTALYMSKTMGRNKVMYCGK